MITHLRYQQGEQLHKLFVTLYKKTLKNINNTIGKLIEKKINQREEIVKIHTAEEIPEKPNKLEVNQETQLNCKIRVTPN